MRLKNTSRYPTDEVRSLVQFGMHGVKTTRMAVNVKNCKQGYRGMAYYGVPSMSPVSRLETVDRLVTLGVGPESSFPTDNMWTTFRNGEAIRHPYGGLRSPLIELQDWREALVVVSAHEARHVWQMQHGKRLSEVDAEKHAARRLAAWRSMNAEADQHNLESYDAR